MTAKVENHCAQRLKDSKRIVGETGTRACINCAWFSQYYRQGRSNVYSWVPTSTGYCLLHECQRGALRQPCRDYETKENTECK